MDDGGLPVMASAALAELRKTAQLEGAAILDLTRPDSASVLLYDASPGVPEAIGNAYQLLRRSPDAPSFAIGPDKRPMLVAPWTMHPERRGGLVMWRAPGATPWDRHDARFAASVAGLMKVIVEQGPGDASIDRLTGLPNRGYFLGEVNRHIDRLEQDGAAGTMMLIDLDGLRRVNAWHGRAAGDDVLTRTAALLRAMMRPADRVARAGGDEFAIWVDGMDHMTAAERASALSVRRLPLPGHALAANAPKAVEAVKAVEAGADGQEECEKAPDEISFSIGIASRKAGGREDARALLRRAHKALWDAKEAGGGGWSVSRSAGN